MKGADTLRLAAGTLILLSSTGVLADSGDLLALNVSVSKKHDENLFKRPRDGSLGNLDSDTSTSTQVGLSLNKQYSLQRIAIKVGLTDNRYQTFKALDGRNENHSASWQWQFTPRLTGNLSATRSQAQSDFADFRGSGQNIRSTDSRRFDANWQVAGGWSLGAGVANTKSRNSQPFQEDPGSEQRIVDANLTYKFASGTSLALLSSNSRGEQGGTANPLTLSDNRFRERRHDLKLNWPFSGVTTLSGGLGQVRRIHDNFSVRDYTEYNGNAVVSWAPTGKTQFTLTRSRTAENWQQPNSSFSIRDLTALGASWAATPKVSMRANVNWTERSFGGDIPGQPSNNRIDKMLTSSLGIDWAAYRNITLGASISDERRRSTVASTDYRSRMATLNANIEF
jgi:exopolysaccharide biosynthesis operon protein EpsL